MQRGGCNPTGFGASASQELALGLRLAQHCEACPAMRDQSVRCPLAMSERMYACLWYAKLPAFAEASGRGVLCARVWISATASIENVVIGPVFAYRKMSVSQFSVVPVLSQSKTGTTVLSCGNVSEYTFSECTFREGRRCWSRQPDMQASALPAF